MLNVSSGDTGKGITVSVSPPSVASSIVFSQGNTNNPDSSSIATLTYNKPSSFTGNDLWKLSISGTNSPSATQSALACTSGICATQASTTNVPPQVLIQMMYGEANATTTNAQIGVGVAARNRLGDSTYFSGDTDYQNTIVPAQFNGIATGITSGVEPELDNAVSVWLRTASNFITPSGSTNSACFFTPTAAQWGQINAAMQSGTTDETQVPNVTGCYSGAPYGQQIRVVASIGANSSGVPWFVFQGPRAFSSSPVAIQF